MITTSSFDVIVPEYSPASVPFAEAVTLDSCPSTNPTFSPLDAATPVISISDPV